MTKQEIQALIDAKIAGQGSAVDIGGALPTILSEILNMAASGENVQSDWAQTDNSKQDFIKNKPTIPSPYTLPVATDEVLGGVKVGSGLNITEQGVLSASGGANVAFFPATYSANLFTVNDVTEISAAVAAGKVCYLTVGTSYHLVVLASGGTAAAVYGTTICSIVD